jgi:hypothetical protein
MEQGLIALSPLEIRDTSKTGIVRRLCFSRSGPLIQIKRRRAQLTVMRNGLPPVGLIQLK